MTALGRMVLQFMGRSETTRAAAAAKMSKPPLSREDALRVVASVMGTKAVLVGGQAVAWWAAYYVRQQRIPELTSETEMYVSKDIDFLGDAQDARACAQALGGVCHVPDDLSWDTAPVSAAQVHFVDGQEEDRDVDFLFNLCGVQDSRSIQKRADRFETDEGTVYVVDAITCMKSRFANVITLGRRDAKSLQQARVAVWAAREWLVDRAEEDGARPALREIRDVFRFARHHPHARQVALRHGIEAFDAIKPHDGLPARFHTDAYPRMRARILQDRERLRSLALRARGSS